jgi:hypothetical protein
MCRGPKYGLRFVVQHNQTKDKGKGEYRIDTVLPDVAEVVFTTRLN